MSDFPPTREPVLLVVNNGYERRYFFSASAATRGLGWLRWEVGEVQVYRLDSEATDTLNREIHKAPKSHDPKTGTWLKQAATNFQTIIRNCTGIKEK